jgi:hypothetical protein
MCFGIFKKYKITMFDFESNLKYDVIKSESDSEKEAIQQFIEYNYKDQDLKYEYSIRKNDDVIQIGLFKDSYLRFGAQMDMKRSYCLFRDFKYNYSCNTFNINFSGDHETLIKLYKVFDVIFNDYYFNLNSNEYILK